MRPPILAAALLAFALSLCAGSMAHASDGDFLTTFRTVCIANLNDLTQSQATARSQGFAPADQEAWVRDNGGVRQSYLFRSADSPGDVDPPVSLTICIVSGADVPEAHLKAIGDWAGTPAVESDTGTDYRFRVVGGRHVAVGGDDPSFAAGLKLGPVFVVNIKREGNLVAVTLGRVVPRK